VAGQQRFVVVGTVQWTSSDHIQLMTDTGVSIDIDVSNVDESALFGVHGGPRLRIVGVASPDGKQLIADSVEPGEPGGG
jgi:hypothetical protein